jgi:hypothetical protein
MTYTHTTFEVILVEARLGFSRTVKYSTTVRSVINSPREPCNDTSNQNSQNTIP